MALILDIAISEESDGESFKIYDRSDWTGEAFDHTLLTYAAITVTYDSTDYIYKLVDTGDATDEIELLATFDNIFGNGAGANMEILPSDFTPSLADTYYVDGYYTIKLDITYDTTDYEDTNNEGFLAQTQCKSTMLPLLINMNNIDYKESRLHFMIIALLNSAQEVAEMGRQTQFEEKLVTINDILDSRDLSNCW